MKKTICLITDWYPTIENPYRGIFCKEQAFVMADSFDFLIIHYNEKIKTRPGKKYYVRKINEECNTVEYNVDVMLPPRLYFCDIYNDFKVKHIQHNPIDGVGKYISEARKKYTEKMLVQIFEENFKDSFDVLYCVDAQREAYNLACVANAFHKPYIIGEHGPVPWPGSMIRDTNKFAMEKADLFLAISNDKIRQILLQNIKLPKIVYIGNYINENQFLLKERIQTEKKTFLIVAAHSFYKNYDMFIQVMNKLTQISKVPFNIIIAGYASNKGYSKDVDVFEKKIRNSAFSDRVELIPQVPHEKIGDIYNRADAFVMTSIQEGQPISALEAACCGLPIFSTRCGGVEDYVDEKIGRIYNITDVEGMAHGLNDYLEGKIVFDSHQIRKRIIDQFGTGAFTGKFAEVFEGVIND